MFCEPSQPLAIMLFRKYARYASVDGDLTRLMLLHILVGFGASDLGGAFQPQIAYHVDNNYWN